MLNLSACTPVLCIIFALSNAQRSHLHHWNHYEPQVPTSLGSIVPTVSSPTPSISVRDLNSSPNSSPVTASSASSSNTVNAPHSTASDTSSSSGASSSSGITPNGIKAGLAGFPKIQTTNKAALDQFAPHISWYSDYWPNTTDFQSGVNNLKGIGMVRFQKPTHHSSNAHTFSATPSNTSIKH